MIKIKDLDIPIKIKNTLTKGSFDYLEDILKTTINQLIQIKGLGNKSLHTIFDQLKLHNLPEMEVGEPVIPIKE